MNDKLIELENLIADKRPELYKALRKGASEAHLRECLGVKYKQLPPNLESLWVWRDGQDNLYAGDFHPAASEMFMSVHDATEVMEMLNAYVDSGDISSNNWRSDWLPITENGGGNFTCVSLNTGEVCYYDKYAVSTRITFSSITDWLQEIVDGYRKL